MILELKSKYSLRVHGEFPILNYILNPFNTIIIIKKPNKVNKKMVLIYEEVLVEKIEKIEDPEPLGELNPRYYEEAISLKDAKIRIDAAQGYPNFSFNNCGF